MSGVVRSREAIWRKRNVGDGHGARWSNCRDRRLPKCQHGTVEKADQKGHNQGEAHVSRLEVEMDSCEAISQWLCSFYTPQSLPEGEEATQRRI